MQTQLTIEHLWDSIATALKENKIILQKNYSHSTEYTKLMTSLLERLGYELGYKSLSMEYWPRVDISYFDKHTEKNWEEWAREVAIEIENDSNDWEKELDKLFCINAGKKVLITYWDATDDEILQYLSSDEINSFSRIYKSRKYHQMVDEYLLVFGPITGGINRNDFVAFKFNGSEVTKLEQKNIFNKE